MSFAGAIIDQEKHKCTFRLHDYQINYEDIDFGQQYGISVTKAQTSLQGNAPSREEQGEVAVFAGYLQYCVIELLT